MTRSALVASLTLGALGVLSGDAIANSDLTSPPTELVFKSAHELLVARAEENTGFWRSLCLQNDHGSARIPVDALQRFGLPRLHEIQVSHGGGIFSGDDGQMYRSSAIIIRFLADVFPEKAGPVRTYRVVMILPNTDGPMASSVTVRATEEEQFGKELPDPDGADFPLEIEVDPLGECTVPTIRWIKPPGPSTPRDGRSP